jgi:hypothetical protein
MQSIRLSLGVFPATPAVKRAVSLPWGAVVSPFEAWGSGEASTWAPHSRPPPARCDSCLAYVNPWCKTTGSGCVTPTRPAAVHLCTTHPGSFVVFGKQQHAHGVLNSAGEGTRGRPRCNCWTPSLNADGAPPPTPHTPTPLHPHPSWVCNLCRAHMAYADADQSNAVYQTVNASRRPLPDSYGHEFVAASVVVSPRLGPPTRGCPEPLCLLVFDLCAGVDCLTACKQAALAALAAAPPHLCVGVVTLSSARVGVFDLAGPEAGDLPHVVVSTCLG